MAEQQRKPTIRPRRIIERPRLIRALDDSDARIKLLVAGTGWGKTVLAEQWAAGVRYSVGWFRARSSAEDIAVVVQGLAAAADVVQPGAGRRVRERLTATKDPATEAVVLGEMLADGLRGSRHQCSIVIDNYDEIAASEPSVLLVETLARQSPGQLIVSARERPTWASVNDPNILELRQSDLSLTAEETAAVCDVRVGAGGQPRPLEGGWPMLVGLLAMTPDARHPDVAASPDAVLKKAIAQVLGALDERTRFGLIALASIPTVDLDLAKELFGTQRGEWLSARALDLGLLDERDGRLELHPLLAGQLRRIGLAEASEARSASLRRALAIYRSRRDWDSAFELVRWHGLDEELATLMLEAVDEILASGRLSTLEHWVRFARSRGVQPHPVLTIAELEVQLRRGRHMTALTGARQMIDRHGENEGFDYRLHLIAARAANMGSEEEDALEHFRSARRLAQSVPDEREARWGELMCNSAMERPEAHTLLNELVESAVSTDATDQVRMADRQLAVGFRFGSVTGLENSRRVLELVDQVDDAFVRCSFLGVHGWALALGAHYDEALAAARRLASQAAELRFDSAMPYAHATTAVALAGLQRWGDAWVEMQRAEEVARQMNAEHALQNSYAIRMRVLLQAGALEEACSTEPPGIGHALRSMRGEVLASRALVLATIGRVDEAESLIAGAVACTKGVETRGLALAVGAVCSLKRRSDDLVDRCDALVTQTFEAGCVDFAVTAYRANPELLSALLASGGVRDQVVYLIRRAGDVERTEALGFSLSAAVDPSSTLSAREREVYNLLCEGLSNAEIARRLYISPSTVKAHVHHVFDKLGGVRSRSALALDAARRRYATSAAAATDDDSSPSVVDGRTVPNPGPRAVR